MNIGGEVRLYVADKLKPSDRVYLQFPGKTGATRCCVVRTGRSFELLEPEATVVDVLLDRPLLPYRLIRPPRLIGTAPFLGAAAVGRTMSVGQVADQSLEIKVPTGVVTVRACTSQEGLHVIGKLGSRIISDLYLGFDYQVENPSCAP